MYSRQIRGAEYLEYWIKGSGYVQGRRYKNLSHEGDTFVANVSITQEWEPYVPVEGDWRRDLACKDVLSPRFPTDYNIEKRKAKGEHGNL